MTTTFIRREDWPERLALQVKLAQAKPYELGVHDCARFVCQCIEAMTGVDLWPRFAGYSTLVQAHRVAVKLGGSLPGAAAALLEVQPTPVLQARRGDIVTYRDGSGEHLGMCTGAHVAVLGEQGLVHLPLNHPGMGVCVRVG